MVQALTEVQNKILAEAVREVNCGRLEERYEKKVTFLKGNLKSKFTNCPKGKNNFWKV